MIRDVLQPAPRPGDTEREDKAQQIELVPRPLERQRKHADVEHRVVREQGNVISLSGRQQQRAGEAAGNAKCREPRCLLQNGKEAREYRERHQQGKCESRWYQGVALECAEDHQHQDDDGGSLYRQADPAVLATQTPTPSKKTHIGQHQRGQPQFNRDGNGRCNILEQKCNADKQDNQAELGDQIPGHQPSFGRNQPARWRRYGFG
jgi:hypothetical protein